MHCPRGTVWSLGRRARSRAGLWSSLRHNVYVTSDWLPRALEESRARGFLGPGPISAHIDHAEGFARGWEQFSTVAPGTWLDLGSGGGVPGLVLLEKWRTRVTLLDAMEKRTAFLREVLGWPDAPHFAEVIRERGEVASRDPRLDSSFELVVARSFGRPAVTAECAARFLVLGGVLIVSEPPEEQEESRWSPEGLRTLGLEPRGSFRASASFQIVVKCAETPRRFPRPTGIPSKRPLW
ncbi:MAG: RsmG family class I SAM-dependent methyltransferase [Acidimicrobiales bacterium]